MDDPGMIVSIIERITKLADPIFQFIGLKDLVRFVRAQVRESIAIHIFHRDAARSLVMHKVVDAHNILVRELEASSRLALEIA